jgi:hypothetical protein
MAKIKVVAVAKSGRTWAGYYGNRRIRDGEVFMVEESEFSDAKAHKVFKRDGTLAIKTHRGWMRRVDDKKPNEITRETIRVTDMGAQSGGKVPVVLVPEAAVAADVRAVPSKPRRASDESIE